MIGHHFPASAFRIAFRASGVWRSRAKRKQLIEAKKLADAVCSLNVELDRQFVALVTLLSQRTTALKQLGAIGVVSNVITNRMQGKGAVTAAALLCGLGAVHRHCQCRYRLGAPIS
jgi:hypothetical protein